MPRKARVEAAGGIHHVWARGVNRRPLFLDDEDSERYLRLLGESTKRYRWRTLAFCLMPNHIHLLIETPEPTLGAGMGRMQGLYATAFNARYARTGHLYDQRAQSKLVEDDVYLATVVGYVALNPVRARLCRHPDDWPWSSFGLLARGVAPSWLAHDVLEEHLEARFGRRLSFEPLGL